SLGLGGEVERDLKAAGVSTSHQSVANTVTDFSSYVTKVPSDADIVFFPTQSPGTAQAFAQQLVEQGKKAKLFTGDGANGLGEFKAPGSYISAFAPSITGFAADKAIIAGWSPGSRARKADPPRREEEQRQQAGRLLRTGGLRCGPCHPHGGQAGLH